MESPVILEFKRLVSWDLILYLGDHWDWHRETSAWYLPPSVLSGLLSPLCSRGSSLTVLYAKPSHVPIEHSAT